MGQLVNGVWLKDEPKVSKKNGSFNRKESIFRNWINDSKNNEFQPESGRYHLYVSHACPWAHRTLIFRTLKNLDSHISVDVVHPDMLEDGWNFAKNFNESTGDSIYGKKFLYEIYQAENLHYIVILLVRLRVRLRVYQQISVFHQYGLCHLKMFLLL